MATKSHSVVQQLGRFVNVGWDFGGIILARHSSKEDNLWKSEDKYLKVPPVEGAFDMIAWSVAEFGSHNNYIISKGEPAHHGKTLHWLDEFDFYNKTGMFRYNISFGINRCDKSPICIKLKITDMIDDRLEILGALPSVSRPYYMFGRDEDREKFRPALARVIECKSFEQLKQTMKAR